MTTKTITLEAKLRESGLSKADAALLKITQLTAAEVAALGFYKRAALKIPYVTPRGKETGFFRLRFNDAPNGFDRMAINGKAPRYVQPKNTLPGIYLPQLSKIDWPAVLTDPTLAIYITEGELKAACGVKHGLPVIGLGGVFSWRSSAAGVSFLPELEAIAWQNRTSYIVFDSDLRSNTQVQLAMIRFCRELTERGAFPHVVYLPHGPRGAKVGLDDYLVAHGAAKFMGIVAKSEPFEGAEALWELNQEVVLIETPPLVVRLEDGAKMPAAAFRDVIYANRHYHERSYDKDGQPKLTKKPLAPAWMKWECRGSLRGLTYRPGAPRIIEGSTYNTWTGWGVEPKKCDIRPWRTLLAHLFNDDKVAIQWFERWCAIQLQRPGLKLTTAVVLWGLYHGTGKSFIGYTLGRIFGENFTEINQRHLHVNHNEWSEGKQFVLADDVTGSDKRGDADILKGMITRQLVRINIKYVPSYDVPDCVNYLFTSNQPDAFFVEDRDRRYYIWEVVRPPMPAEFYTEYEVWHLGEGPAALFHYLLHLDLGDFNPKASAPATSAKYDMIRAVKSDLGDWVVELRDDPDALLVAGGQALQADAFTNQQLLGLYDPERLTRVTANGMGRELRRAGFPQVQIRVGNRVQRLYVVRRQEKWLQASPLTLANHWAEAFVERPKKF